MELFVKLLEILLLSVGEFDVRIRDTLACVIRLRDSKNGLTNKSLRSTQARVKLEQLDKYNCDSK